MTAGKSYRIFLAILLGALFAVPVKMHAQRFAIGMNLLGIPELLTLDVHADVAVSRKISVNAGFEYNPFSWRTYGPPEIQFQNRKRVFHAGVRYWPFYVYSGWSVNMKVQYREFNTGGIISPVTYEGDAFGAGIVFGYSFIVNRWMNIELGVGLWGGAAYYSKYELPRRGRLMEDGLSWFVAPDDIRLSVTFLF